MELNFDKELLAECKDSAEELIKPFSTEWNNSATEEIIRSVQKFARAMAALREENFYGQIPSRESHEVGNTNGKLLFASRAILRSIKAYEPRREKTGFDYTKEKRCIESVRQAEINTFWLLSFFQSLNFYIPVELLDKHEIQADKIQKDVLASMDFILKRNEINVHTQESNPSSVLISVGTIALLVKNIITNAKHHGDASNVEWSTHQTTDRIIWELSDDGSGIDPKVFSQIFKQGFSGGQSTGIGLGDASEKLSQFGASIRAEGNGGLQNESGGNGAKFVIELQKA